MAKDTKKVVEKTQTQLVNRYDGYDHYIGVDWSSSTMAIARICKGRPNHVRVHEQQSSLKDLQLHLDQLQGNRIVVIEESTPAQWLYVNLHDHVEKVVVCDPYRNRLLQDGPKNDKIDAKGLCRLLKNGMVKEVYHTMEKTYELRKYVSAYIDLVRQGVRLQNQQFGFLMQEGKTKKEKQQIQGESNRFVQKQLECSIRLYREQKKEYEELFAELCQKNRTLKALVSIPGIGDIGAVKILAYLLDPKRFGRAGKYLAYCGLVSYILESGGRVYGKRRPRFCRVLKDVYKTAAVSIINGSGPLRKYYDHLLKKGLSEHNARHQLARYVARISFGIVKKPKKFTLKKKTPKKENRQGR